MPNEETLYLQRHQEGLPLVAETDSGALVLSHGSEAQTVWAEFPLKEAGESTERFDITVEAFRKGERLGAREILDLGIPGLSEDPDVAVRLVIDHTSDGDPLPDPEWEVDGVEVFHRPTIDSEGRKADWVLARRLPCLEVRTFQRTETGEWIVNKEPGADRKGSDPESPEAPEEPSSDDRYTALSRSIPTRPLARPFGIHPVNRASMGEGLQSFRM